MTNKKSAATKKRPSYKQDVVRRLKQNISNIWMYLKRSDKKVMLLGGAAFIVLTIIGAGTLLYLLSTQGYSHDKDSNKVLYTKFPIVKASLKVYRNDEIIIDETLDDTSGEIEVDFSKDGFYKIEYKAFGKSKEEEFAIDRTGPIITAGYPKLTNKEKVDIKVSLNEEGTASLYMPEEAYIDEETGEEKTSPEILSNENNTYNVVLVEGENKYTIKAVDEWGNGSSTDITIKADFTKPQIEIIQPTYTETYESSAEFKFRITDNVKVKQVTMGEDEIKESEKDVYGFKVDYKDGDNVVKIKAFDTAGNKAEAEKAVLKRVSAQQRIDQSNSGSSTSSGGGGADPALSGCSNAVTGYNVFCWNNSIREGKDLSALSWNSSSANHAYWVAYCLETTGFQGNPHYPSQEAISCISEKSGVSDAWRFGAEVANYGYSTAQNVANAWANSSSHSVFTLSADARTMGVGCYGKWCIGYVSN